MFLPMDAISNEINANMDVEILESEDESVSGDDKENDGTEYDNIAAVIDAGAQNAIEISQSVYKAKSRVEFVKNGKGRLKTVCIY
jgi:hypothetical protein